MFRNGVNVKALRTLGNLRRTGKFDMVYAESRRTLATKRKSMSTIALQESPQFQVLTENKEEYISNLKSRLDESWAAGLSSFISR